MTKIIEEFKERVLWRFTIGTLDDEIREKWEPGAPTIKSRLQSLEELYANYWKTSVSIEPFLGKDLLDLIDRIDSYITDTIWIGPMNKIHVPKELWTQELTDLYSPKNLYSLKQEIDNLNNPKIRYKDHFLSIALKYIPESKEYQEILVYH
ncbi:MAG: hypothetical protein ACFE9L_18200 [Candidatus Hodarchaeota archaeon]